MLNTICCVKLLVFVVLVFIILVRHVGNFLHSEGGRNRITGIRDHDFFYNLLYYDENKKYLV